MAAAPPISEVAYSSDGSFKDVLGAIKRQTPIIVITVLVCLAISVIVGFLLPPVYQTEIMLYIEGRTQQFSGSYNPSYINSDLTSPDSNYDILTQIARLTSLNTISETWERAGIPRPELLTEQALEKLPSVKAEQRNQSNAVVVKVTGPNEKDVYNFATELPVVFEDDMRKQQQEAVKQAKTFINGEVTDEQANIKALEDQLSALKAKSQISDSQTQATVVAAAIRDLELQTTEAKAESEGAAAGLAKAQSEYAAIPATRNNPTTETNFAARQQSDTDLSALQQKRAQLLLTYTEESPQIKAMDAQIAAAKQHLDDTPKQVTIDRTEVNPEKEEYHKLVSDAEQRKESADAHYRELSAALAAKQAAQPAVTTNIDQQQQLETQIKDHLNLLSQYQDQALKVSLRENNISQPLKLMSPARPAKQVQFDWVLYPLAAAFVGLILGSIFAVARDNMHDRITNTESAEQLTGVPLLASIPRRKRSGNPAIEAHHRAVSFEGYRLLRTNMLLKLGNAEPKQVLFTSMVPGEGVSVVTANLATACAAAGHRTIYVDVNFRRPSGSSLFGLEAGSKGLAEALASNHSVSGFLSQTSTPGLEVLTAGTVPTNIGEILASPRMKQIIDELGTLAEIVIYDASAFQGVADSVSLASAVGRVVVVVVPGVTPKPQLKEFSEMMTLGKVDFMGVVMNKTETNHQTDQYLS